MTVLAGIFLLLFGGGGSWLLATRFASATYTRIGYAAMAISGIFAVVWAFSGSLPFGVSAVVILVIGGLFGIIGAFRKELRIDLTP